MFTAANAVSRLASCRISGVVATAPGLGARGGAIYVTDGQLHLTNTSLTNNLAMSPPAGGAAGRLGPRARQLNLHRRRRRHLRAAGAARPMAPRRVM